MPQITFHNVTISIHAASAKKALAQLGNLLDTQGEQLDYETDTYSVEDERPGTTVLRDTSELWPAKHAKPYSVELADSQAR